MSGLSRTQPVATAILWGTHEPTADDWLEYLTLLHPVMKDTVDAALAKLDTAAEKAGSNGDLKQGDVPLNPEQRE